MIRRTLVAAGLVVAGGGVAFAVEAPIALDGKCPVCLVEMNRESPGAPQFQAVYDGWTYLFPNADMKKMFDAAPQKYAVQAGGCCRVCKVDMQCDAKAKGYIYAVHDRRIYIFPSENMKATFLKNPEKYAVKPALALNGDCPVCLVEMNMKTPGSADHVSEYGPFTYRFPDDKMKKMFDAKPEAYAVQMGGICPVCRTMGKPVVGDPALYAEHRKKIYVFPDEKTRTMFKDDPDKYVGADPAKPAEGSGTKREGSRREGSGR